MNFENYPIILLSGGRSSRMGQPKGLLDYSGKLWIEDQLESIARLPGARVVVVLGFYSNTYFEKCPALKASNQQWRSFKRNVKIFISVNPQPENGPFSSFKAGLSVVTNLPNSKGVFLLPIDVPCPNIKVWEGLVKNLSHLDSSTVVPEYKGRGGHPVLLSLPFCKTLMATPCSGPEARLDVQIKKFSNTHRFMVSDSKVTLNLNRPEDWKIFHQQLG